MSWYSDNHLIGHIISHIMNTRFVEVSCRPRVGISRQRVFGNHAFNLGSCADNIPQNREGDCCFEDDRDMLRHVVNVYEHRSDLHVRDMEIEENRLFVVTEDLDLLLHWYLFMIRPQQVACGCL